MSDTELMLKLIERWHSERADAEKLLKTAFELREANEILKRRPKATLTRILNTSWYYKTHGAGVLITKKNESDGIDFDFDKPYPDEWRLDIFLELQHRGGKLDEAYQPLVLDKTRRLATIKKALQQKSVNEIA